MWLAVLKAKGQEGKRMEKRRPLVRYLWVAAFIARSGPVWLYPRASKLPLPETNDSFVPYSILRTWKMEHFRRDVRAG